MTGLWDDLDMLKQNWSIRLALLQHVGLALMGVIAFAGVNKLSIWSRVWCNSCAALFNLSAPSCTLFLKNHFLRWRVLILISCRGSGSGVIGYLLKVVCFLLVVCHITLEHLVWPTEDLLNVVLKVHNLIGSTPFGLMDQSMEDIKVIVICSGCWSWFIIHWSFLMTVGNVKQSFLKMHDYAKMNRN